MKKWMMAVGLVLVSGSAGAVQDIVFKGDPCKITEMMCWDHMLIRQNALFAKLPNLKMEKRTFGTHVATIYSYNGQACGSWPEGNNIPMVEGEKYIKIDDLPYALFGCAKSIRIKSLSKPILYIHDASFDLSGNGSGAVVRSLIAKSIGSYLSKTIQSINQTFSDKVSYGLVLANYQFSTTGMYKNSLYAIVKNMDSQMGALGLEIGETDASGKMTFYSDTPNLTFHPSLKGFENFKANDAVMIRLTGRLDQDIFDFDHPPKLSTLKGAPIAR